jgi:hypothetical protein
MSGIITLSSITVSPLAQANLQCLAGAPCGARLEIVSDEARLEQFQIGVDIVDH